MPRSCPCPSTTDLPSPTSSPTITSRSEVENSPPVQMQVLSNQQVLRKTTRNAKKSYGGIIVGKTSAGVGKGGEKISMTRAMKVRKKK